MPKFRWQPTFNPQMIQLQLDGWEVFREVATDVANAHVQAGDFAPGAQCFDHHGSPRNWVLTSPQDRVVSTVATEWILPRSKRQVV
jgi:hypothetical protein